jgi:hypothetical protein
MLEEVYGKAAMKQTQIYNWHKHFHDGRVSANDILYCGGTVNYNTDIKRVHIFMQRDQ